MLREARHPISNPILLHPSLVVHDNLTCARDTQLSWFCPVYSVRYSINRIRA